MLTVKLILERLDKEGRLLERREQRSKSFIIAFLQLLYVMHAQIPFASPYSMTDIGGAARDVDYPSSNAARFSKGNLKLGSCAGSGGVVIPQVASGDNYQPNIVVFPGEMVGIQVGTGTNAVTPTDYGLQTRVDHGRSGGELEYGGCELVNIVFSDPNGEFTIRRYFTNHSGGPITVEEVGIYAGGGQMSPIGAWIFCIARDVVAPGVAVADGEILRATYVPQITV